MKVIYLHQYFNTRDMPGSTRSFELARRLVAKGHQVHMITTDRGPNSRKRGMWRVTTEAGITVHWASISYRNSMSFLVRIRAFLTFAFVSARRCALIQGDVVFATSTPLTIAIPAIFASRRAGIPMVFEVRDLWPDVPIALGVLRSPMTKWAAKRLERLAYRRSSYIIALAPGMREEIAKTGFERDRIVVIPNGCDIDLFQNNCEARKALRDEHPWLQSRPLVSYIGTIGRVNAVDYLVRLAYHTLSLDEEIRFVVVGTGAEEGNVRELAIRLGVYGVNFFMMGQVSKTTAAVWTGASTINVALVQGPRFIWKDATQNKYFDSLAAGRPVASNYDGWQAEVATAAGAGVILDASDHQRAATQLLQALHDTNWLNAASATARELAEQEYSRDSHADELERVLFNAMSLEPAISP